MHVIHTALLHVLAGWAQLTSEFMLRRVNLSSVCVGLVCSRELGLVTPRLFSLCPFRRVPQNQILDGACLLEPAFPPRVSILSDTSI